MVDACTASSFGEASMPSPRRRTRPMEKAGAVRFEGRHVPWSMVVGATVTAGGSWALRSARGRYPPVVVSAPWPRPLVENAEGSM